MKNIVVVVLKSFNYLAKFLSREIFESHVCDIVYDVPLLNLTRQEHVTPDIFHHID